MDIVLDLWIHAIYNDEQVQGSDIGPVVYFRNCTGNPLVSYTELALRWGISKSTVSRDTQQTAGQGISFAGVLYRTAWQRHLSVQLSVYHVQYQ